MISDEKHRSGDQLLGGQLGQYGGGDWVYSHKKSRATRCDRVALFSIESQSLRFPTDLLESSSV